jgi:hypothetical protein
MVVVDSLNGQDLNRAGDDLNRLVHELARIGENHRLARSARLCVGELDDYSLKIKSYFGKNPKIGKISKIGENSEFGKIFRIGKNLKLGKIGQSGENLQNRVNPKSGKFLKLVKFLTPGKSKIGEILKIGNFLCTSTHVIWLGQSSRHSQIAPLSIVHHVDD